MGTRLGFRPRPVDVNKQLSIVRDVSELDSTDGLTVKDGTIGDAADAQKDAEQAETVKPLKGTKEIPTPAVRLIVTHSRDYLPVFNIPDTYIRSRGAFAGLNDQYVEYDLDLEDEEWLNDFNKGTNKLNDMKFEKMLWTLDITNAEATDKALAAAGAAPGDRITHTAAASLDHLKKEDALNALRINVGGRELILDAVYNYWWAKRKRLNKPLLRRLQAATSASDTNPFSVFRLRERVNRPQTRRRRETGAECAEKLRLMQEGLVRALEITNLLLLRETKKRDAKCLEIESQRYQIALQHGSLAAQEAAMSKLKQRLESASAAAAEAAPRLTQLLELPNSLVHYADSPARMALVRKRSREIPNPEVNGMAISRLPPPPPQPSPLILFTLPAPLDKLPPPAPTPEALVKEEEETKHKVVGIKNATNPPPPLHSLPSDIDPRRVRARVSRTGRVIFARCDPWTLEPYADSDTSETTMGLPPNDWSTYGSGLASDPLAAALDLSLIPECIDRGALVVLRQNGHNRGPASFGGGTAGGTGARQKTVGKGVDGMSRLGNTGSNKHKSGAGGTGGHTPKPKPHADGGTAWHKGAQGSGGGTQGKRHVPKGLGGLSPSSLPLNVKAALAAVTNLTDGSGGSGGSGSPLALQSGMKKMSNKGAGAEQPRRGPGRPPKSKGHSPPRESTLSFGSQGVFNLLDGPS